MWFDARAKLAEIMGQPPATQAPVARPMSQLSRLSQGGSDQKAIIELLEERAAIRQFEGGLNRADAENAAIADVARTLGIDPAQYLASGWREV
jgi:outer membrane protein TolC